MPLALMVILSSVIVGTLEMGVVVVVVVVQELQQDTSIIMWAYIPLL